MNNKQDSFGTPQAVFFLSHSREVFSLFMTPVTSSSRSRQPDTHKLPTLPAFQRWVITEASAFDLR
ncbi:hypothetical protein E2C01_071820 [Portunus trituberculatus]|uniref:Uncharacterized protein n=1 Tax=Portunus trituberculatus TaxID=210409 RepID=A0A5B7I905_PORTR|nr:hypothetical protein [Portunus trituberculatus]